jgi:hypothetical protein
VAQPVLAQRPACDNPQSRAPSSVASSVLSNREQSYQNESGGSSHGLSTCHNTPGSRLPFGQKHETFHG